MQQMYRYHRLEFRQHIKKMLALFVSTEITLLLIFGFTILGAYEHVCIQDYLDPGSPHGMIDVSSDQIGICHIILKHST